MELRDNDTFFFDLDKTLWTWDDMTIGAADLIDTLRTTGRNVRFHTDNTILSREEYVHKLRDLGVNAEKEEILTAGYVAAQTLIERDITEVYVCGESGLIKEIESHGINISKDADTAVVGLDRQFNYRKLENLMRIAEDGGKILICSSETTFRRSKGDKPHQGPINQAIRELGETELIGKPSDTYRKVFREYFSYYSGKSALIGDRFADIKLGNDLGFTTAAVLSGEITEKKLKDSEKDRMPDYILTSLHKLRRRII